MDKIKAEKAKAAAEAFFDAWKDGDYDALMVACQGSWLSANLLKEPKQKLVDWFGDKELLSYKIGAKSDVTKQINKSKVCKEKGVEFEGFWKVQTDICYKFANTLFTKALMVNVIVENEVYAVNPISVLSEKESSWNMR